MMQNETTSTAIDGMHQSSDIMMTEYRLKMLQEYSREKRALLSRTLLTGMKVELRPSELNVEKQYKGQQSLKVNYM